MKPIFTKVEDQIMSYGLYDRLMSRLIHWLNDRWETRTERIWDQYNAPAGPPTGRKRWDRKPW